MDIDDVEETRGGAHVVIPGELITGDSAFMKGHGTFSAESSLFGSVAGTVERVNKLISVKPTRARYHGDIGDVVVGRILEVGQKRWRVDIGGRQDAVLLLAAINLPGGEIRRRSESDELHMRSLLAEGDMISAEIQAFFQDGAASLQTRSLKYGKLRNGSLVIVPSSLIKRSKSHFISLTNGVDVILGLNGHIWVSKHNQISQEAAMQPEGLFSNQNEPISKELRMQIARVCCCLNAMAKEGVMISETLLVYVIEVSARFDAKDILANSKEIMIEASQHLIH
ncbi:Exosome complex component RRP4 [Chytridiales sp. JEL 0842]|nr:Exosome complex component RRP4 [Chytridiales sp. JEL 0842]